VEINWDELDLESELQVVSERFEQLDIIVDFLSKEIMARLDDPTIREIEADPIYDYLIEKRKPLRQEWDVLIDVRGSLRKLVRAGKRLKLQQQIVD
jgi:hypothetical protein